MMRETGTDNIDDVERAVLTPLIAKTSQKFWITVLVLSGVLLWGLLAWVWQIINGLKVTGLSVPVFWGVYIINFVFFIALSMAGTLLSSILRITGADWRRPFTRVAETITIASLPFGGISVIIDMGRPERLLNTLLYPHPTAPILWDILGISTYLVMSCLYFYVALLPDLAFCRDRISTDISPWRFHLYRILSMGWKNTPQEARIHHRIMGVLSIILLGMVVTVHSVLGFIFGLTIKPGWHSAVIAPYFVIGAAFQGLGVLAAIIILVRRLFHLEHFLTAEHLRSLKKLFLAVTCFWGYFTLVEFLTTYYGQDPAEMKVFWLKITGQYSPIFWAMLTFCFFIPFLLLVSGRGRIEQRLFWSGISVNIGMWLERYLIVVSSALKPFLPFPWIVNYVPSWVECSITAACFAGFLLLFLVFTRIFPILTVWEMKEQ